ncbi:MULTISPECIES: LPXTG cell wall anchor domain-containing protein [unclassified Streptomyces]|uniref:LPXTG cell wall anchor domain-containing protein n=1 Tax=unclassified Streptomyces TaxID=2593676 RepID=UPI001F201F24|nr:MULTISPECIES: LPXTG cell wall anchor domain-containing protein [unclassified Streptomyces]
MKLRRAMAVAAATAVITPAAFLMSPAAYAVEGPSASPEASVEATPSAESGDAENDTPENDSPSGSPEATASEGTEEEQKSSEEEKAEEEQPATTPEEEKDGEEKKDEGEPSEDEQKEEEGAEGEEDVCIDAVDNEDVDAELQGLPSKVVAGSGWKEFTFRVVNNSDKVLNEVEAYLYTEAVDGEKFDDMSKFVTVQANVGDGWETITDEWGYFGTALDLKAGEYAEAPMRLMVSDKAPAGYGVAFASGVNITDDGICEFGEETAYEFEILAADAKPGKVDDATGKPGKSDNKPAPQGNLSELPVTGSLAETGSSSMLPTIGIAGGVAIVAGAGVVFALKRRNSGATA